MKTLRRVAVVLATIASTLGVATAAHASTCYSWLGTYLEIDRCGTWVDVVYLKAAPLGHPELWEYGTSNHFNGANGSRARSTSEIYSPVPWDDRTCVEYWIPNGSGGWNRLNNEIDCTDG